MTDINILIIGAGPTGLTAALEFAKHGIKVDIVEKRKEASTLSRAVGIMPGSLRKLGKEVSEKILAESIPFYKINFHLGEKRALTLDVTGMVSPTDIITGLPQDRTEEIIREELSAKGVDVAFGSEVTQVVSSFHSVDVWFNNLPEKKTYDWVIACDGVGSITRQQLGIDFTGYELEKTWSIADVEVESTYDFSATSGWIKVGKNCDAVVAIPIGHNRTRLISSTESCLDILPVPLKVIKTHRKGTFRISIRQATTYLKGRVLLAGDAAHSHSPVGGRGMNLGIDDAVAAVSAILNDATVSYSEERHKIGQKVIRQSEFARKNIMSKNPFIKLFFKTMFFIVNKSSFIQSIGLKRVSKL